MKDKKKLDELIQTVLLAMVNGKYSSRTIKNYRIRFNGLLRIAKKMGTNYPTQELFSAFMKCAINSKTKQPDVLKVRQYIRCINLLSSVMVGGSVDWSRKKKGDISTTIKEPGLRLMLDDFLIQLIQKGLNANTICSYKRIVSYFFSFCEKKGYTDLSYIKTNNLTEFIMYVYQKGYFKPTTITSVLSGFRQFLSSHEHTKQFVLELPSRFPKERKIIEVYDEQELLSIKEILSSDSLSKRDLAICILLIETGLRGIDVCELKLADIDWEKDIIRIIQSKTKRPLNIPLRSSYGNAIADYVLHERPDSDSEYLFLRSLAPFEKLDGASSIRHILQVMEGKADIQKNERISGSRFTRQNAASTMLRAGVPMADISAALGHRNPNVVAVYLSTDKDALASCTLPLPFIIKRGV